MIWTYRIFRDLKGRYSLGEVFYERDGTLIGYGQEPAIPVGTSLQDLMQQMEWFQQAFGLPVLATAEVDAEIAAKPASHSRDAEKDISLRQIKAKLALEAEAA